MLFIIVWNVGELFVILKNITRGSKELWLVQKTAFHLSSGLMQTLLNSQYIFNLVLSNEFIWRKKPSVGKFAEDIRRVWEHSLIHVDEISGWLWL